MRYPKVISIAAAALPGLALAACSGTASPASGPTAQAVATQSAPTVQAAATRAAPTIQAAATQAAPTIQAGATAVQAAATQAQPTVVAAATQVAPTVQAAATQAAPTVQAAATQAAPTAEAAATRAAPTIQAIATQSAPLVATASAAAPVHITQVQSTPSDTAISIENTSASGVDLSGWKLQVGSASAELPAGLVVQPGQAVSVHTGSGTSTSRDVYLGPAAQSLVQALRPGAQVVLQSPNGPTSAFIVPGA